VISAPASPERSAEISRGAQSFVSSPGASGGRLPRFGIPPPKPKRILQDGEMMLDGEITPFDEELWKQHQDRWVQNLSKDNADDQNT
jgi:hypothetical protein